MENYCWKDRRGRELDADLAAQIDLASERQVGGNFRSLAQTWRETATAAQRPLPISPKARNASRTNLLRLGR